MGDMADMMLDGTLDQHTGEYIDGQSPGYPRSVKDARRGKKLFANYKNCKELNGIAKFLQRYCDNTGEAVDLVVKYCKNDLDFEGTIKECAIEIQKDFGKFVKHVNKIY